MRAYTRRGIHGQVVETLAGQILTGVLAEGGRLDIDAMQQDLGVSRTVLREALKVLAAKGLVDARQKRGTFVRPRAEWNLLDGDIIRWQFAGRHDAQFLANLAEIRAAVEPAVARLAADRRTPDDLATLSDALDAMRASAGDLSRTVDADLAFHCALLAATRNELFERMEVLLEPGLAERDRLVHGADQAADPVPSHQAVFDAIKARRPAAAELAMRRLLDKSDRDLARIQDATDGRTA